MRGNRGPGSRERAFPTRKKGEREREREGRASSVNNSLGLQQRRSYGGCPRQERGLKGSRPRLKVLGCRIHAAREPSPESPRSRSVSPPLLPIFCSRILRFRSFSTNTWLKPHIGLADIGGTRFSSSLAVSGSHRPVKRGTGGRSSVRWNSLPFVDLTPNAWFPYLFDIRQIGELHCSLTYLYQ
jgi:hypothetical protein